MTRHFLLALCLGCVLSGNALAQNPPADSIPESFPTVTPLPPKPPVAATPTPTPEPTTVPTPVPTTSATPIPNPTPTSKPTAKPTSKPTAVPTGKGELSYSFPKQLTEGKRFKLTLQVQGAVSYPVKGFIRYEDGTYNYSTTLKEAIPFEIKGPGAHTVSMLFRSAGRKQIRIETAGNQAPARNALAYASPFAATVFPVAVNTSGFQADPSLWKVWVNLHHSLSAQQPQRQYYLVTYRGEIIQKLLTSSAAPGKLTPQGNFNLGVKIASPTSTLYDSVMPFWTTILVPGHSYEYGNHGLTGEAYLYSLGVPASHGCLRLSNKWVQQGGQWVNIGAAKWVYSHVPVGTPIQIFKRPAQPFAFVNYNNWLAKR